MIRIMQRHLRLRGYNKLFRQLPRTIHAIFHGKFVCRFSSASLSGQVCRSASLLSDTQSLRKSFPEFTSVQFLRDSAPSTSLGKKYIFKELRIEFVLNILFLSYIFETHLFVSEGSDSASQKFRRDTVRFPSHCTVDTRSATLRCPTNCSVKLLLLTHFQDRFLTTMGFYKGPKTPLCLWCFLSSQWIVLSLSRGKYEYRDYFWNPEEWW